ncbi:MAG: hypothetical protein K6G83_16585 [Lachnospiraceae bacterium]|nr:hypothetical protein [Lachnospiraceae bacterium]
MGLSGELSIGDVQKKKEELNRVSGINTNPGLFQTEKESTGRSNPYAVPMQARQPYMSRVDELANKGPLMETRIHTQNSEDIAFSKRMEKGTVTKEGEKEKDVNSTEKQDFVKARSDLAVFNQDVVKNGTFSSKAKEAARHFFSQLKDWAGSFEDGGSGFYSSMGINSVMDCLYVDGMSLRNYLREQYYYKTTGKPAQDEEAVRNYVAMIAARGNHIITLVRPTVKSDGAEVEYKNLYVDLSNVGEEEAARSREMREKGNQLRSNMKKRIDREMTERTGMAYRMAYGCKSDGFNRIEGAKKGLGEAGEETSEEYKAFEQEFEHYNGGLQKLGLKPGRDDINLAVAEKLRERCEEALHAADVFLRKGSQNEQAMQAVKKAKKALQTDKELLDRAISTKLDEEGATMRLDELFDSKNPDEPGKKDPAGEPDGAQGEESGNDSV